MGIGDLFRAVLVNDVVIARRECVGVPEGDLLLAEVALALDALAVHARAIHAVANVAQQRLHAARGKQCVVDVVVTRGREVVVALGPGLAVGLVENDELEFGAHIGHEAVLGEAINLVLQNLARVGGHGPAVHALEVGDDERGGRQPRDAPQRSHVGLHDHVAVAGLPRRERVALDGVHLDVNGEQIVAAFGAVSRDLFAEQSRRDALADEAALHVGKSDDDGVDLPRIDEAFELSDRQISRANRRRCCRHGASLGASVDH